jgi:2,3-bisphosphoglycerate-dependent phosphoglycerate mutase
MAMRLVLVRHGESEWNRLNLFTGWYDCDLTEKGVEEATAAGPMMVESGVVPDVVHTSVQRRAIRTAELCLGAAGRSWIPVRRSWRLNERHYGALQGLDKKEVKEEFGEEQLMAWRRSYDTPPPAVAEDSPHNPASDPRYAGIPPEILPRAECLADVLARVLPYFHDSVCADLYAGKTVLIAAHGNSLRAIVKHLDAIGDDAIAGVNIPTGVPLAYELGADYRPLKAMPLEDRYLMDAAEVQRRAEAVAKQAG